MRRVRSVRHFFARHAALPVIFIHRGGGLDPEARRWLLGGCDPGKQTCLRAWILVIVTSLLLCWLATSKLHAGAEEWGPFESEGTVLALQPDKGVIQLDHEPIQGPGFLMAPMQMPFTVADPALLNGLSPGDRIRFRVSEERKSKIIELRKLTK